MFTASFLLLGAALEWTVPTAGFQSSHFVHNDKSFRRTSVLSPSATFKHVDDSNMNDLLFRPKEDRPKSVLVDACAVWCGPCKLIEPYLMNCATVYADKLSVLKYNVEDPKTKDLKVEMLLQGVIIRGLPTLVLYHNGRPLATHSGAIAEDELCNWLDEHLFSKLDDLEAEQELGGEVANVLWSSSEEKVDENKPASSAAKERKRGFVSMTSRFGSDDYMLSNY